MSTCDNIVSIITVTRNAARTIEETARSVMSQKGVAFEWIVVDGASSDNTVDLVRHYARSCDIVISEADNGIYNAMNKGLARASGRYCLYLNADDVLTNSSVLQEVSYALARCMRFPVLAYGSVYFVSTAAACRQKVQSGSRTADFIRCRPPHHQGCFFERDALNKLGGFPETFGYSGDIAIIARLVHEYPESVLQLGFPVAEFRLGGVSSKFDWAFSNERHRWKAVALAFGPWVGALHVPFIFQLAFRSCLRRGLERCGLLPQWWRLKARLFRASFETRSKNGR